MCSRRHSFSHREPVRTPSDPPDFWDAFRGTGGRRLCQQRQRSSQDSVSMRQPRRSPSGSCCWQPWTQPSISSPSNGLDGSQSSWQTLQICTQMSRQSGSVSQPPKTGEKPAAPRNPAKSNVESLGFIAPDYTDSPASLKDYASGAPQPLGRPFLFSMLEPWRVRWQAARKPVPLRTGPHVARSSAESLQGLLRPGPCGLQPESHSSKAPG